MSTLKRFKKLFIDKFDSNNEALRATTTLEHLDLDSFDKTKFMFDNENKSNIKISDQEFKITAIQDIIDAVDRFVSEQRTGILSRTMNSNN